MRRLWVFLALCAATVGYSAETNVFTDAQKSFWSLQAVRKPAVPAVQSKQWVKNPIDAFVLNKLEDKQLQPNKPADKLTLLRRVTIDLTGLPPTPNEIQAFLSDNSPNAYEKVVDRLLASPAYGDAVAATGSMLPATPIATDSRPTERVPTSGAIATTSSKPSTTTNPTIALSASRSPATNSIRAIRTL